MYIYISQYSIQYIASAEGEVPFFLEPPLQKLCTRFSFFFWTLGNRPDLFGAARGGTEPLRALKSSFGAFWGFNTFIWSFTTLQNLHLELLGAWTSSFGSFHNFKPSIWKLLRFQSSVTYMQLQYLCHESFVASELTLTSSSDYGLISRKKCSWQCKWPYIPHVHSFMCIT